MLLFTLKSLEGTFLVALVIALALAFAQANAIGESENTVTENAAAAAAAAAVEVAEADADVEVEAATSGETKVRSFQFPALFNFASYQKLYRKSYRSAMERSARLGLYLARKHRVFISAVKYRHFSANYYLGINTRSDWTPDELDSLQNKLVEPQVPIQAIGAQEHETSVNFSNIQSDPDYKPLIALSISRNVSRHYEQLPNRGAAAALRSSSRARLSRLTNNLGRRITGRPSKQAVRDNKSEIFAESQPGQGRKQQEQDALWVDHRRSECLAEIQDQGLCGACYIFASLAYLEWAHCRETGTLVKFSEQYLVDCGAARVRGLHGCAHGLVTQVGVFVNNFGLETNAGYGLEYAAAQNQCPYSPSAPLASMGSVKLDMLNVVRVPLEHLEDVLEDAPLVVNIGTSRELYEYGGGVYDGGGCSKTGHHSVLLIGHGRDNGEEYWLLRNSESASYGESGHLRLNKNSDCITPQMGFMFGRYAEGRVRILPMDNGARRQHRPFSTKRRR